ncbi:MAG: transcriptional regulator [Nitrosarchaeum sp.]|nr:MAG: transcriptional regulator [Nitrosarchaeum sp.]
MDKLDIKILSRLLNNCRESDRQIGKELGISGGAVKVRIKKMEKNKIIKQFTIKVEPPVLGLGVIYIVVTGQNIKKILEQVTLIGEPYFVVPCVGGITVCSIVVKENLQEKILLANKLIVNVRILSIFEVENIGFNSNLTKTDLEILEYLLKYPREKIDNISKKIGFSTKTITRCIDKLQENDGIQFTVIYNPTKIDNYIPFAILAWIDIKIENVLKQMNKELFKSYMQIPFISKKQIVLFMYSNNVFEMDEFTQRVKNMKNVKSTDLFIPKSISLPLKWLEEAIKIAKKSTTLHLSYQTN